MMKVSKERRQHTTQKLMLVIAGTDSCSVQGVFEIKCKSFVSTLIFIKTICCIYLWKALDVVSLNFVLNFIEIS